MKRGWVVLLLIVLFACGRKEEAINQGGERNFSMVSIDIDSSRLSVIRDSVSRSVELEPFLVNFNEFVKKDTLLSKKCEWYCMKYQNYVDSSLNCVVRIDLPKTKSWRMNEAMKRELFKQRDAFLSDLVEMNVENEPFIEKGMNSSFHVELISAYQDSSFVSFCFAVSYYSAGAAHGMPMFYSFNFDRQTNRRITFNDYFHVETPEDSLVIIDLVRVYHGWKGVHLNEVYEYDFNLKENYVVFNFDAYEITGYAYGTPRVPLNRKMIEKRFGNK